MFDTLYIVLEYAGWTVLFLSALFGLLGVAALFGVKRYDPDGDDGLFENDNDLPGDWAEAESGESAGKRRAARIAAE